VTYIENVFVCMAAPLVVALLSLKRGHRAALVFCLAGMGACLLSAYLNTFFARLYQADAVNAATQIAPVVEEIMKLLEQINENGTTVLVVTHNREIVNAMQKRVVTMKKGVIVSDEEKGGYIDDED